MCVIIHQPSGSYLTKDRAQRLWKINSDGGGFTFIDNDGLIQAERAMEFTQFWTAFERARSAFPQRDFLLHMRIATHGDISLANCHPFWINDETVMMHNGILNQVPDYDDGRSDTGVFVDEVIAELPENWLDNTYLQDMMEEYVGYNKLAFLTTSLNVKENVIILNRTLGSTVDGMWFSNTNGVHEPKIYSKKKYDGSKGEYTSGNYPKASEGRKEVQVGFGIQQMGSCKKDGTTTTRSTGLTSGSRTYRWENGVLVPVETDALYSEAKSWPEWLSADESTLEAEEFEDEYEQAIADIDAMVTTVADIKVIGKAVGDIFEKEVIVVAREKDGNTNKIAFNPTTRTWECMGCDEDLDPEPNPYLPGDCACWEKICADCSKFTVMCSCKGEGWVRSPIWMSDAGKLEIAMAIDAYNDELAPF